jgi:hypothetical protein
MEQIEQLDDGIYFGLDEETYFGQQRLSNSGIKLIRQSPMDFWVRSWFNETPLPAGDDDTFAKTLGKAYHKRIVEGKHAFAMNFVRKLEPSDYPMALSSQADLKAKCKELDLKVGGSKVDLAERLLIHYDCDGLEGGPVEIFERILADYGRRHSGKEYLPDDTIIRIETAAQMLEGHPQLNKAFTGGQPEVSILWTDEESGVKMKCRIDYLKPNAIVDLKSFSNPHGKPVERAVATAVANYKYQIQVATYLEAASYLPALLDRVHPPKGCDTKEFAEWAKMMVEPEKQFLFIFQQTGVAPVTIARTFPRNMTFDIARIQMRDGISRYAEYSESHGTSPWIDAGEIEAFTDEDFPIYITE